jgi:hypothetical protein
MRLTTIDPTARFDLASLRFQYGDAGETLYTEIVVDATTLGLVRHLASAVQPPKLLAYTVPVDVWTNVVLDTTLQPGGGPTVSVRVTVLVDGVRLSDDAADYPIPDGETEACFGIIFVEAAAQPITVLTDNVVVDVTPAP